MDDAHKPSLKDKIKQFLCLACCFTTNRRETLRSSESPSSSSSAAAGDNTKRRPLFLIGASSQWIRSRASVVDLPEIKYKCRSLFGRIGGGDGQPNHRRRRSSTDFSYDPLSYALNFEEESCVEDDVPLKNFASRLPSSPPPSSTAPADRRNTVSRSGV